MHSIAAVSALLSVALIFCAGLAFADETIKVDVPWDTTEIGEIEIPHHPLKVRLLARFNHFIPGAFLRTMEYTELDELVGAIAYLRSPEDALAFVRIIEAKTATTGAGIHGLKHVIGHSFYQLRGLQGIRGCGTSLAGFDGACYHGFMEKFLTGRDLFTFDMNIFADMCVGDLNETDCLDIYHGVGHGLVAYLGLEKKVALDQCSKVTPPAYQFMCMSGVNMEWSETVPFEYIEEFRESPWDKCTALEDRAQVAVCSYELPRIIAFLRESRQNVDFSLHDSRYEIGRACAFAPNRRLRSYCFQGAGFMAAMRPEPGHSTVAICEELADAEETDRRDCLVVAARRLTVLNEEGEYQKELDDVCSVLNDRYDWDSCAGFNTNLIQ